MKQIINYFLILILGVGLGYAWRMAQVNDRHKTEIAQLEERLEENKQAIFRLEGKLAQARNEIKKLKKGGAKNNRLSKTNPCPKVDY